MKHILLLGSTGSIGRNVLDVVRRFPDRFTVCGLAAGGNADLLARQTAEFSPQCAYIQTQAHADLLAGRFDGVHFYSGSRGLEDMVKQSRADLVVSAISGFQGLLPTYVAIAQGKQVALANKESLVCGGDLLNRLMQPAGAFFLPIDSEHNGIFNLLKGKQAQEITRVVLTASGGPLLHTPAAAMANITVAQALAHPNWRMGRKISIDSATMANKVLEVIEAHYLFGLPYERIDIVVHPQSVVHAMVQTKSQSIYLEAGPADMRIPIGNALFYPQVFANTFSEFCLTDLNNLTFIPPDKTKFKLLTYLDHVSGAPAYSHIAFNAANEEAVGAFLAEELAFDKIADVVFYVLDKAEGWPIHDIKDIMSLDAQYRRQARAGIRKLTT